MDRLVSGRHLSPLSRMRRSAPPRSRNILATSSMVVSGICGATVASGEATGAAGAGAGAGRRFSDKSPYVAAEAISSAKACSIARSSSVGRAASSSCTNNRSNGSGRLGRLAQSGCGGIAVAASVSSGWSAAEISIASMRCPTNCAAITQSHARSIASVPGVGDVTAATRPVPILSKTVPVSKPKPRSGKRKR